MFEIFLNTYLKMFFILSPFFSISVFLSFSESLDQAEKRTAAARTTLAVILTALIFLFFGSQIFSVLGVTLAAFQIGAGTLLFLNAMSLVSGKKIKCDIGNDDDDFAVVPLALPLIVGPGAIGTLLVIGAELNGPKEKLFACIAVITASLTVGIFLYMATPIERIVGRKVLSALTKLTGLVLTSLAAQIIFSGIRAFLEL